MPLPGMAYAGLLRSALVRSYALMQEHDRDRLRQLVLGDTLELLQASAGRFHGLEPDEAAPPLVSPPGRGVELPPLALRMEEELLPRALVLQKSLISTHPQLDPELADLARRCRAAGITTHVLLLRAYQQTHGAVAVHWIGEARPEFEFRNVFYAYWDNAGLAVAVVEERARAEAELAELRQTAFRDRMTGLPNAEALERQLEEHAETESFSALVLDFDGLRAANTLFGHKEGGDLLIKAVGKALGLLAADNEFPARMHTAGDEFALLLPRQDEAAAATRRAEVEAGLDALEVPERFRSIYRGASVGCASRRPGETAGQVLGRASEAMSARKRERKQERAEPESDRH